MKPQNKKWPTYWWDSNLFRVQIPMEKTFYRSQLARERRHGSSTSRYGYRIYDRMHI